jgi:hypothetical protein
METAPLACSVITAFYREAVKLMPIDARNDGGLPMRWKLSPYVNVGKRRRALAMSRRAARSRSNLLRETWTRRGSTRMGISFGATSI